MWYPMHRRGINDLSHAAELTIIDRKGVKNWDILFPLFIN